MIGRRRLLEAAVALYAGLVGTPLVPLGASALGKPVDGYLLALGAFVVATGIGFAGARQADDLLEAVSTWPGKWLFLGPAVVYFLAYGVLATLSNLLSHPWLALGTVSWFFGIAIAVYGHDRRMQPAIQSATTYVSWESRHPRNARYIVGLSHLLVLGMGGLLFVDTLQEGGSLWAAVWTSVPFLLFAVLPYQYLLKTRSVKITDAGLVVQRTLHPWKRITGYRFEKNTLIFDSSSRFGGPWKFDRNGIEDESAVRDALERAYDTSE